MKITFESEFVLGADVYLSIRNERVCGRVTKISLCGASLMKRNVVYDVTWEDGETTEHYESELTDTFVKKFKDVSDE